MRWRDLEPDPEMLQALAAADGEVRRTKALLGTRAQRNKWSNAFADACARMVAGEMRKHPGFRQFNVLPDPEGSAEPPTFVAADRKKKVDVVVSSAVSGLQVGVSLKGMNFRDRKGNQFDKNLTGRTYELENELRLVHEYQPASFMVALYFMPIGATTDKRSNESASSFARTVRHLSERTGRLDPFYHSHMARADMAVVCLYVPGDEEETENGPYADFPIVRGAARYFDAKESPPMRGRPKVDTTHDLTGIVGLIAERWLSRGETPLEWAAPEPEE